MNPELVPHKEKIILCSRCYKDPTSYCFSIASGHDYGIISSLPTLTITEKNAISPFRLFGNAVHINKKTCSGHFISFASDGPSTISSKILPIIDTKSLPQVTFIGTKEQWRIDQKKYSNLHSVSADNIYEWLNVLCDCNEFFRDKGIQIDSTEKKKKEIKEANDIIEKSVIITLDKNINALDEIKAGDRYGEDLLPVQNESKTDNSTDEEANDLFVTNACVMQDTEHLNFSKKRFAKTLHEYIKTEEKKKK